MLSIKNLSKTYSNGVQALDSVDLDISVGVVPFNKLIDRNSEDNVKSVALLE